jgi:hypothetical protein
MRGGKEILPSFPLLSEAFASICFLCILRDYLSAGRQVGKKSHYFGGETDGDIYPPCSDA